MADKLLLPVRPIPEGEIVALSTVFEIDAVRLPRVEVNVTLFVEDDENVKVAEVVLVPVLLTVKLVLAVIDVVAVPVWLFLLLLIVALSVAVAVRDNVALLDDVLLVVFEPPVAESSLVSVLLRDTVKLRLKLIVGDAVVVLDPLVLRVISRLTVSVLLIEDDRVGDSGDRVCDSE